MARHFYLRIQVLSADQIDWVEFSLLALGGLALFLYAVGAISDTIQQAVGEKGKTWILKLTGNVFMSILTGTLVTALLDSSSAVIIITIVLVNAGLLRLKQAMGIVLGANIGTTISSQVIALDVAMYSPIALTIGLVLVFIAKSEKVSQTGKMLLMFGMLFFGLYTLERAVEPLRSHPQFFVWMGQLEDPSVGSLVGAFVTLVVQSSSATVGMAITLAKKELITLAAGIAIMMGAELGTCSDTLLATIRGTRQALKTGLFHLAFNLISICIGLLFFTPYVDFISAISKGAPLEQQLANAHMLFNLIGALAFSFLVGPSAWLLNLLIPEKSESTESSLTETLTAEVPSEVPMEEVQ